MHIEFSGNHLTGSTGLQMPVLAERQQRWQAVVADY
jgi:hypothetical protein